MDEVEKFILEYLTYDPDTGIIIWKQVPSNRVKLGSEAGYKCKHKDKGYITIRCAGRLLMAHRVAWFLYYNKWPNNQIDHENQDRKDNRISNLRDVPNNINGKNQRKRVTNTSGHTGVYWNKAARKWCAEILVDSRYVYLGLFEDINDAIAARQAADIKYGLHPNHGREKTKHE